MNLFSTAPPNRSSRLYRGLVDAGLAAGVSGSLSPMLDPYLYSISAVVQAGLTLEMVEETLNAEMDRILQEPISADELHTAIKQSKAQFAYSSESVTNQGFWLGYSSVVADTGWFESFLGQLTAVTIEDVARVANTYLSQRNRTVGHYVPTASAAQPSQGA